MRILFVCSAGVNRSRTAAEKFREWFGHETRFRGCHTSSGNRITDADVEWCERIVCFEDDHLARLHGIRSRPLDMWDVPDVYVYGDPVLVDELRRLAEAWGFGRPGLVPEMECV